MGRDGSIPEKLAENMIAFGNSLKSFRKPISPAAVLTHELVYCSNTTWLQIDLDSALPFNAVISREDLSRGQSISSYSIDFWNEANEKWQAFPRLSAKSAWLGLADEDIIGVHGFSVGPRMIDFVPQTTARKIRFRCISAMAKDTTAYLEQFSLHQVTPQMIAGTLGAGHGGSTSPLIHSLH
jgi:hypothetical protein